MITTTLHEAATTLDQALRELGVARPKGDAVHWLLGLVYGESRFGTSPDWCNPDPKGYNTRVTNPNIPEGPSHNWGAVRHHHGDFFLHGDRNADGSSGVFRFQWYPTAVDGAKGFLRTLLRGKVPAVLQDPLTSPYDLAAAMYENGYYTGVSGSREERIQAYGNMIKNLAANVRKELGSSPAPLPLPKPPIVPPLPVPNIPQLPSLSPVLRVAAAGSWALGALGVAGLLVYYGTRRSR